MNPLLEKYKGRHLLTQTEVCDILKVGRKSLIKMIDDGRFPQRDKSTSTSACVRYSRESIRRKLGYDIVTGEESKKIRIPFMVKASLVNQLDIAAKRQGVRRSTLIGNLLTKAMKEEENGP